MAANAGKTVTLKRGKARLFKRGNPLVYGGAVERTSGAPARGDVVDVLDGAGDRVGWGMYNPDSMYRVRLLGAPAVGDADEARVAAAVDALLAAACGRRSALGLPNAETTAFRLVNSEGDGLSGLTVDAYGAYLVCSVSAAWVDQRRDLVVAALARRYEPLAGAAPTVLWRRAAARLRSEGLEDVADDDAQGGDIVEALEAGLRFEVDVYGQKTGFYCDQRDNRAFLSPLCRGKRVLDLYCYSGGFALSALRAGAESAVGVDSSAPAVALATRNAGRNGLAATFEAADVSAWLKASDETFDVVVCANLMPS